MNRIVVLVLVTLLAAGCSHETQVTLSGRTMGTTYSVKIIEPDVDSAALKEEIDAELVRINDLMSTYIVDSELNRFNRSPVGEWMPVSKDLLVVVRLARQIHDLSGGAFDPTVGPLVNLWGFGPTPADRTVPSDEQINEAMTRVGFDLLEIGDTALKRNADVYVDLSAIAKGYGVDQVAHILDRHGYRNYLVEIGGEVFAKGRNARELPWRIAIERPDTTQRVPFKTLDVSGKGVATSGDYRNYFEVDGKRYSHTIDPATGRPITHNLASVTVIAENTALADALATTIDVLGPEKGMALAVQQKLPVFAIIKSADGFIERHSPEFEVYLDD
ncbi:MAG: FAD:protein FMN transferase [Pseudomonadales bacterium]|nr:FAD:protein FMN transferase [Pseudomonadales bacterium]